MEADYIFHIIAETAGTLIELSFAFCLIVLGLIGIRCLKADWKAKNAGNKS